MSVVYNPSEREPRFAVSLVVGEYRCEWFDPQGKAKLQTDILRSKGGMHEFEAPFDGDAVLFLQRT